VHFHTLTPDGVFELDEDGPARFVSLPPPKDEDVEAILRRVIRRTAKVLADYEELLAKIYEIDVLACPECGGRMKLIAFIAEPTVAKRILDHLGLDSTGPPLAPPRVGQADSVDPAPAYIAVTLSSLAWFFKARGSLA